MIYRLFSAALLAVALMVAAAPTAHAQSGDLCSELQQVSEQSAAAAADPAQQQWQTRIHETVTTGYAELHCQAGQATAPVQLNEQFLASGYQSQCTSPGAPPQPPAGQLTQRQFNTAVAGFNNWAPSSVTASTCRVSEVGEIRRQRAIIAAAFAAWTWRTTQQANATVAAMNGARPRRQNTTRGGG